jgi:hypothetical protein
VSQLGVDGQTILILIVEAVESPLSEFISIADVLVAVKENERLRFIMVIEDSF